MSVLLQFICALFGHPGRGKMVPGDSEDFDGADVMMVCRICGAPLNPMYHR